MATQKQDEQDGKEFEDAFNAPEAEATAQTEDEAFGISPEITDDVSSEGEPATTSIDLDAAAEEAGETPAEESAEGATGEANEEIPAEDPPMTQNDKTWEGRLRKREEEIALREAALESKEVTPVEEASGETIEGTMSSDEAMSKLADDFGPEFVEMIKVIASGIAEAAAAKVATQTVETVDRDVKDIIAHLQDAGQKAHFKEIAKAHPDFMDVAASPEFKAWSDARPDENKTSEMDILEKGSADQVIKLLDEYKASAGQDEDNGEDAAEGVRSGGIMLPETPQAGNDDYEAAWKEA